MGRGRRPNMALEPTRALQTQRAFRQRKAEYLAQLEDSVKQLTNENDRLKKLMNLDPSSTPSIAGSSSHPAHKGGSDNRYTPIQPFTPQSNELDTSPSSSSIPKDCSNCESVEETKKQLSIAANQVEQQMSQLHQAMKALRSVLQTNQVHTRDLFAQVHPYSVGGSSVASPHDELQRPPSKRPRLPERASAPVFSAEHHSDYTPINGVNMTSSQYYAPSPPVSSSAHAHASVPSTASAAADGSSRHLPPPFHPPAAGMANLNSSNSHRASSLHHHASASNHVSPAASWHASSSSPSMSGPSPPSTGASPRDYPHQRHLASFSAPMSPIALPGHHVPAHPSQYPSEAPPNAHHFHQTHQPQHQPYQPYPQPQHSTYSRSDPYAQHPPAHSHMQPPPSSAKRMPSSASSSAISATSSPSASNSGGSAASPASYSATRSLAMQALNSPHSKEEHASNECAKPLDPSSSASSSSSSSFSSSSRLSSNTTNTATTSPPNTSGSRASRLASNSADSDAPADAPAAASSSSCCPPASSSTKKPKCGGKSSSNKGRTSTNTSKGSCGDGAQPTQAEDPESKDAIASFSGGNDNAKKEDNNHQTRDDILAPPSPLGISVDMRTQTPAGEKCCFGLVECDDQGRIII